MRTRDDELTIGPGRIQHGNKGAKRPKSFVGEVMRAAKKAGHTGKNFRGEDGRKEAAARRCCSHRDRRASAS